MMNPARDVGVLVGSLRKASFSRRLAHALAALAPPTLAHRVIDIGALPLYNQDDEASPPAAWTAFRGEVKRCDALLFVTPEYNRSIPSALKNAIDVGSRPKGSSVWDFKPAAVISASPGVLGAFGANHHLRQCLMCLNVATMPAPEAYIGGVDKALDEQGGIAVASTREFLETFMRRFADWVERNGRFGDALNS
jgi:chromate reductase, NAD(P)H dehydrogenase (quinone)